MGAKNFIESHMKEGKICLEKSDIKNIEDYLLTFSLNEIQDFLIDIRNVINSRSFENQNSLLILLLLIECIQEHQEILKEIILGKEFNPQ